MRESDSNFAQICDAYAAAIYEKNISAFLGLYLPEARVFDTWGVWSYEGVNARRGEIEKWFSSLGEERVRVTIDRLQTESGPELATLSARVVYAAQSAAGVELRAMQNRLTWVLRSQGGLWKIIHEHTSVPIGFNDLKGMLRRNSILRLHEMAVDQKKVAIENGRGPFHLRSKLAATRSVSF